MRNLNETAIVGGCTALTSASLIGSYLIGGQFQWPLIVATTASIAGSALLTGHYTDANIEQQLVAGATKTLSSVLDLGAFIVVSKGLQLARAGYGLIAAGGAWAIWRITDIAMDHPQDGEGFTHTDLTLITPYNCIKAGSCCS
jgi:drug/metabolite transporter (DMT)-like permease